MTTCIKPFPAERCTPLRSVCAVRPSARANRRRPALSATLQPTIPPSPITRKCRAGYSPALAHLNPTARATNKPLNSTRQSLRSLHFTSLRVHCAQSVSAVQRKRTLIGAALRFAPFAQPVGRAGQLTLARTALIPATPDPKSQPTAHCKPPSTFVGRTRFIPPPLREYAPRSSMKRPATAPEGAERRIRKSDSTMTKSKAP